MNAIYTFKEIMQNTLFWKKKSVIFWRCLDVVKHPHIYQKTSGFCFFFSVTGLNSNLELWSLQKHSYMWKLAKNWTNSSNLSQGKKNVFLTLYHFSDNQRIVQGFFTLRMVFESKNAKRLYNICEKVLHEARFCFWNQHPKIKFWISFNKYDARHLVHFAALSPNYEQLAWLE